MSLVALNNEKLACGFDNKIMRIWYSNTNLVIKIFLIRVV